MDTGFSLLRCSWCDRVHLRSRIGFARHKPCERHYGYLLMTDLGIAERLGGGPWQDVGTTLFMLLEPTQQGYCIRL